MAELGPRYALARAIARRAAAPGRRRAHRPQPPRAGARPPPLSDRRRPVRGARPRPRARPDPGHAGRALRRRRRAGRHGGPHHGPRPLRGGRGAATGRTGQTGSPPTAPRGRGAGLRRGRARWPTTRTTGPRAPRRTAVSPPPATGGGREVRAALQEAMWRGVGVERDADGLEDASEVLAALPDGTDPETDNLLLVARLSAAAAALRTESRGAHFRRDHPAPTLARPGASPGSAAPPRHRPGPGPPGSSPRRPHDPHRHRARLRSYPRTTSAPTRSSGARLGGPPGPRLPRRHPGPPLSARRGHRVRGRHRRLVPAGPARGGGHRGRAHRLPRRLLHGRGGRRPPRAAPDRPAPRPRRRAPPRRVRRHLHRARRLDADDRRPAGKARHPADLHELRGRPARRSSASTAAPSARRATPRRRSAGPSRRADAVFFFPDEHLGRNTACRLGMAPDDPLVWNPRQAELGGIDAGALAPPRR